MKKTAIAIIMGLLIGINSFGMAFAAEKEPPLVLDSHQNYKELK